MADIEQGSGQGAPSGAGPAEKKSTSLWMILVGVLVIGAVAGAVAWKMKGSQEEGKEVAQGDGEGKDKAHDASAEDAGEEEEGEAEDDDETAKKKKDREAIKDTIKAQQNGTAAAATEKKKESPPAPTGAPIASRLGGLNFGEGGTQMKAPHSGSTLSTIKEKFGTLMQDPRQFATMLGPLVMALPILKGIIFSLPVFGLAMAASGFLLFLIVEDSIAEQGRKGTFIQGITRASWPKKLLMLGLVGVFCWAAISFAYPLLLPLIGQARGMIGI